MKKDASLIEAALVPNGQLQVCIGEDHVIIPSHKNPGPVVRMIKLGTGDIVVNTYWSLVTGRRSPDGGQTWEEATCMRSKDDGKTWNKGNLEIGDSAFEFPDGEAVMFHGPWGQETKQEGAYAFPFRRWTNYAEKQIDEQATMILPQKATKDQKGRAPGFVELFPDHSMIQLRDGSLMASVQGNFPYDATWPQGWRTLVVRSTDRGRTWNYLSTVSADLEAEFDDGFCEAVLLTIPNGDILCTMRTGGLCTGADDPKVLKGNKLVLSEGDVRFVCDPLHLSLSTDDGMSWSPPRPISEFGVYPNAILMEDGLIALCFGRPGNWIMFSLDYGKTWTDPMKINDAPESIDAGHYNSLVEVEPGKLLLGYAQNDPDDHTCSEIHGTFIYVKRLDK